ncbi:SCO1/SenC-domain-containing protein [Lipomyces kononenkoae]|uniref:SCO1/SenC-domain-containing protein n=1 Tax=Lipomyces kononenkoae TaxID=34357 RepID=A0ACC3SWG2_LIPKO
MSAQEPMRTAYQLQRLVFCMRRTRPFSTTQPIFDEAKSEEKQNGDDLDPLVTRKKRPMAEQEPNEVESVVFKVKKTKRRNPLGFFNIAGMLIFVGGLALLINYKRRVQRAVDAHKEEQQSESFGKALIGGPFQLIDQNGGIFTQNNLKDKFSLIYFGFTLCPDICPEELDKMSIIVKNLKKQGIDIQPIFISCDPLRDTPPVVKKYLEDFDIEGIVGLTGSYHDVEACCKAYRVYFSTPPDVTAEDDYIVDHSIFFYLMDPEGEFVNVFGRRYDAQGATEEIGKKIKKWVPAKDRRESSFQKPSFWKFWE